MTSSQCNICSSQHIQPWKLAAAAVFLSTSGGYITWINLVPVQLGFWSPLQRPRNCARWHSEQALWDTAKTAVSPKDPTTLATFFRLIPGINSGDLVVKTIANHPFGNGVYHLFMVIRGMVYCCFNHVNDLITILCMEELLHHLGWLKP